jgi:formylmethanofuran dehydrogenase subunit E
MASRPNGGEERPATSVATPAETVHAHSLSEESFAGGPQPGQKICCVCGKDVAHEERFKDKKGRYWCYECGVEDSHRRHQNDLVKCPDCGEQVPEKDLVEYEGRHFCQGCVDKRTKAARREAARKAAAEEAERESERKRKQIIVGSVAFAVVALGIAGWAIFM